MDRDLSLEDSTREDLLVEDEVDEVPMADLPAREATTTITIGHTIMATITVDVKRTKTIKGTERSWTICYPTGLYEWDYRCSLERSSSGAFKYTTSNSLQEELTAVGAEPRQVNCPLDARQM